MGVLQLDSKSGFTSSGKMSVHFLGAAFDRCHSPRTIRAEVQRPSPRAQQRSPSVHYEYFTDQASDHTIDGQDPADPVTPSACRTPCHAQANPFSSLVNTPGAQPSPTGINLFQQYFVPSPSLLQQVADGGQQQPAASPMSPGGVARAQRRPALNAKSRFGPGGSPGPSVGTPGSPFVVRSVRNSPNCPRVTFMSPSSSDTHWSPGSNTSPSHSRTGRRRFLDDEDGVSAALISTFEEGAPEWREEFLAAKFSQANRGAASPTASSVVSLGMFIEPEEDGSDYEEEERDYSHLQALQALIPMPNYSDSKPPARSRLDLDDEQLQEGGEELGSPTKTPSRRLFASPGKPIKAVSRVRAGASRFCQAERAALQLAQPLPPAAVIADNAAAPGRESGGGFLELGPIIERGRRLATLAEDREHCGKSRREYRPNEEPRKEYRPSSAAVPMPVGDNEGHM